MLQIAGGIILAVLGLALLGFVGFLAYAWLDNWFEDEAIKEREEERRKKSLSN